MSDCMTFPNTVEEFMEQYKVVDTDCVYSNGIEFVPIFRMKQWFEHLQDAQEVQPDRMKLVQQAVNTIMSTSRSYSIRDRAFRNAARLVQCAIDGEAPDFEQIPEGDEMPSEPKWIPCSERLPEETVLVTVETKTFRHRYICEAVWIPRWTWKASFDNWEDCSEYNEDEDEFYVNEGWYERVHNWDEYSYVGIEDDVLAWMPLPEPYREEGEQE